MSIEGWGRDPCRLFINALKEVVDLAEHREVVTPEEIWKAINKSLGDKNWYPKYTDKS